MRIDFLGLEAFVTIAERGSFRAAASHLNLSQTALSHRIRKLEEALSTPLLLRTTRQVSLTQAGLALLPRAGELFEQMGAALAEVRTHVEPAGGRVAVGCLPTIASQCLPQAVEALRLSHPEIRVAVHDSSASSIADKVQAGEVAFGVTIVAANRWDLELSPVVKEAFVLVCRRDMPLAGEAALAWADLDGLPLVRVSAETGNRILIDDALGARRELLSWQYEVQRVSTAVSLVRAARCYAILPQLALDPTDAADLVPVPLRAPAVFRTLGIVTRKGATLSGPERQLLRLVREALKQRIASHPD